MNSILLAILRLVFGSLALGAIGWQLTIQVRMGFSVVNFFSYFTNLSNLFAAFVLLHAALRFFTRREAFASSDQVRAVSAVNMAVVGIVFTVLLRNEDLGSLLPWINFVLHYVMPCIIVLDWLLQAPARKLGAGQLLLVQVFPALYLAYVLVRGSRVGWYPYPFLNPANVGGYGGVAAYAIGIALSFLITAWSLLVLGNKLNRPAIPS
ncbi:MAG: Pr6Pr family membrane protein [Pseudomonadota bacterium]